MDIISFAWTSDAFLAGCKSCTRREWSTGYARRWKAGKQAQAYNRSPRYKGIKIGTIKVNRDAYQELSCDIPDEDYEAEGFGWMERNGIMIRNMHPVEFFDRWRSSKQVLWVLRFDALERYVQFMSRKFKEAARQRGLFE